MLWRENIENGQNQGEKDAGHKLVVVTQGIGIEKLNLYFILKNRWSQSVDLWLTFLDAFNNPDRDNDYNTLTGQDMKLTSEPTWDSAMISARKMNKTIKDCVWINGYQTTERKPISKH